MRPSRQREPDMECSINWDGEARFIAHTGSGHELRMEGAGDLGGQNQAARPMELILAGAGGCTAYDVVLILKRGRHAISGCGVCRKCHGEVCAAGVLSAHMPTPDWRAASSARGNAGSVWYFV